MRKTVLILILSLVLLVGSVSAWDWDNVKRFEDVGEYGKISIKNGLGMGGTLAEYELISNTDVCFINCNAYGKVTLYEDGIIFSKFNLYNKDNQETNLEEFNVYIKEEKEIEKEVIYYEEGKCQEITYKNLSKGKECKQIPKTKIVEETITTWKKYNQEVLETGSYEWKIEGKKEPLEGIDWVPTSFGKELSEWAWWNPDWSYKRQLTITGAITEGNIINFTLDTSSLVTSGYVNPNMHTDTPCDNLTVVYQDTTEINSTVLFCNTDHSQILFNVQSSDASGTNTDYAIYYSTGQSKIGTHLKYTKGAEDSVYFYEYNSNIQPDGLQKDDYYGYYGGWGESVAILDIDEEDVVGTNHNPITNLNVSSDFYTINFSSYCGSTNDLLTGYQYSPYNESGNTHEVIIKGRLDDVVGTNLIFGKESSTGNITLWIGNLTEINETGYCGWNKIYFYPITNLEVVDVAVGAQEEPYMGPFFIRYDINSTSPINNFTSDDVKGWYIVQDNESSTFYCDVYWLKNNVTQFSYEGIETTNNTQYEITLESENFTTNGDAWRYELNCSDGSNEDWINSTEIIVLQNLPIFSKMWINSTKAEEPNANSTNENIIGKFIAIDKVYTSLKYNVSWLKNNITQFTFNDSDYSNASIETIILNNSNLTVGDLWNFQVAVCNNDFCSAWKNSTQIEILNRNPTVPYIALPLNDTTVINSTIQIVCNGSTDEDGDTIYYEIYADTNNPPTTLLQNSTFTSYTYNLPNKINTKYYIRCKSHDQKGNLSYTGVNNFTVDNMPIYWATTEQVSPVLYTSKNNFYSNISWNGLIIDDIDAKFKYNGIEYTPSSISINSTTKRFNISISANTVGNMAWLWNFSLTHINSSINYNDSYSGTQVVQDVFFYECNSTSNVTFINFTFKNETENAYINGSIISGTFTYSLVSDFSLNKTLSYSNLSESYSFPFCVDPGYTPIYLYSDLDYSSSGYVQRNYNEKLALTNSTTQKVLYLIRSATGQYVTFQVVNVASQVIKDVYATVSRTIGGTLTLLESGYTDDAGSITFYLHPDYSHTFVFNKIGYSVYTTTITPTQTTYTITLGEPPTTPQANYYQGINYYVTPSDQILFNNTDYDFGFNISSSYYSLDSAGFVLFNNTNGTIGSTSCTTSTGCTLNLNRNTNNYSYVYMRYYWEINGTFINQTQQWYVTRDVNPDASFSMFIRDMQKLSSAFGGGMHADFTKAMIAFFTILLIIGTLTYYTGIFSRTAILGELALLTWFFTYIDFIPAPINAVHNFVPWMVTLLFLVSLIGEYR